MSEKKSLGKVLFNGIIPENPTFRLVLGTCPTLAVTTSALNGLGMGAAATFVLVCSNVAVSLLRKFIPDQVRIPAFIRSLWRSTKWRRSYPVWRPCVPILSPMYPTK